MAKFCVKCGTPLGSGPFCVKCGVTRHSAVTENPSSGSFENHRAGGRCPQAVHMVGDGIIKSGLSSCSRSCCSSCSVI